jgi:hypothetical protein
MKLPPPTRALAILVLSTAHEAAAAGSSSPEKYSSYYAAVHAADRGDCDEVVRNLKAFLQEYPEIREKYPEFYSDINFTISECTGSFRVRGLGDSHTIDPLPDLPSMED